MNKPQTNTSNILVGVSDELAFLWKVRDDALEFEKKNDIKPRTSKKYLEAQARVDNYFLPKKPPAQRNKPKKKVYVPEDGWCY